MSDAKHTPGPWETVGAKYIWKTGDVGGAVAIIAEPECESSNDFRPVRIASERWEEAMANARLIAAAPAQHNPRRRLSQSPFDHSRRDVDQVVVGNDCVRLAQ